MFDNFVGGIRRGISFCRAQLATDSLKSLHQLILAIGPASDDKKHVSRQRYEVRIEPVSFFHEPAIAITIVGLPNLSRNAECDPGMRFVCECRFVKTDNRVNKASRALFTEVIKIFFLSQFERFRKAKRGRTHLLKITS